jgi:hypothetical protein
MLPLGFTLYVDAVLVDGAAHREDCDNPRRATNVTVGRGLGGGEFWRWLWQ